MICHKLPYKATNLPRSTGIELLAQFYKLITLLATDANDKLTVLILFLFFLSHIADRPSKIKMIYIVYT